MKTIIVSGSPGTGKTALSRKLAEKLDFQYIDVNKVIKKYNISEGYDKKRKSKIIDTNKLNKALIKEISNFNKMIVNEENNEQIPIKKNIKKDSINKYNKNNEKNLIKNLIINKIINNKIKNDNYKKIKDGMIIDSHLSHYLPSKYVDLCIITKCNLKVLEKRLKKRRYSNKKIRENLDAEIFDVCLNEAKENNHEVFVVDTSKGIKTAINSFSLEIKKGLK